VSSVLDAKRFELLSEPFAHFVDLRTIGSICGNTRNCDRSCETVDKGFLKQIDAILCYMGATEEDTRRRSPFGRPSCAAEVDQAWRMFHRAEESLRCGKAGIICKFQVWDVSLKVYSINRLYLKTFRNDKFTIKNPYELYMTAQKERLASTIFQDCPPSNLLVSSTRRSTSPWTSAATSSTALLNCGINTRTDKNATVPAITNATPSALSKDGGSYQRLLVKR